MVVAVASGAYSVKLDVCPTCAGTTVCSLASEWIPCHSGQGGSSPGVSHPCQTVSLKRTGKCVGQCSTFFPYLKPESDAHTGLGLGLLQEGFGINKNRAAREAARWGGQGSECVAWELRTNGDAFLCLDLWMLGTPCWTPRQELCHHLDDSAGEAAAK